MCIRDRTGPARREGKGGIGHGEIRRVTCLPKGARDGALGRCVEVTEDLVSDGWGAVEAQLG
eukprot:4087083-Pyramimonas_sp.AAC.1